MWSVNKIRQKFIDFFVKNGHKHLDSSPLVPDNDPTLLFTAAGMVPFKNIFVGKAKAPAPAVVTSQKCLRAGGKHNDLDQVGYTARHHTFFEMLGNFSFGDYFKRDAIKLAWIFLTQELGIDADRLWVTVYYTDDEAFELWQAIAGLSADRIIKIKTNDNFWAMGDTGPCGPCSEIFYDHGDHIEGGLPGTENEDGDRFVEIWNLVFMQYDRDEKGVLNPLPNPCIDTGMGLERIAAVMQKTHDNYDINLFTTTIKDIADRIGVAVRGAHKQSLRVVADHLRATCFMMADGILPSNEGRGYVLRRIMRRSIRHIYKMGYDQPVIYKLVDGLIDQMGESYPELVRARDVMLTTIRLEEESFLRTIKSGMYLLEEASKGLVEGQKLPGLIAFKLYDTYGFPLDLTEDILKTKGHPVDIKGFDEAMQAQKNKARAAWKGDAAQEQEQAFQELVDQDVPATEFVGYDRVQATALIVAVINKAGEAVDGLGQGEEGWIVTNQTCFYAESGGQVGDTGEIAWPTGDIASKGYDGHAAVSDTKKKQGCYHAHWAHVTKGKLTKGQEVALSVHSEKRDQARAHHSATHLLHAALREVLGPHVSQKGSLVAPDRLRFDFSHAFAIPTEVIETIEDRVNFYIMQNSLVETNVMPPKKAMEKGAMALFGEKYGDEVRVVSMGHGQSLATSNIDSGGHSDNSDEEPSYSLELCGGTHVKRTGDIGSFVITSEGAVSSGIRRIEAVCGTHAISYIRRQKSILHDVAVLLKSNWKNVPEACQKLLTERQKLRADYKKLQQQQLQTMNVGALGGGVHNGGQGSNTASHKEINNVHLITQTVKDVAIPDMKQMIDHYRQKHMPCLVCLVGDNDGKISVIIGVSKDIAGKEASKGHYDAGMLIREATTILGGKGGGGRPDMAQGGGQDMTKAAAVFEMLEGVLAKG